MAPGACPLVTVTGLTGGAGATSLALALACEAGAQGVPSLIAETCDAGLREVAGAASPLGLSDLPRLAERPARLWVDLDAARVMTWTGTGGQPDEPHGLDAPIADARRAHSLVVLDCGRGDPPGLSVEHVTHRLYVAPASATGLARARRRLNRPRHEAVTIVAVVAVHGRVGLQARDVRSFAQGLADALVFVPHCPDLIIRPDDARELLQPFAIDVLSIIRAPR